MGEAYSENRSHTYVTPWVASGSASLITAQFLSESSSEGLFSTNNWQLVAISQSQWHEKVKDQLRLVPIQRYWNWNVASLVFQLKPSTDAEALLVSCPARARLPARNERVGSGDETKALSR